MKKKTYTKEFKLEAVKLVLERAMKAGQMAHIFDDMLSLFRMRVHTSPKM